MRMMREQYINAVHQKCIVGKGKSVVGIVALEF